MAITADIIINRKLLDTAFEGYKLNSSPLPLHVTHISEGVDIARPSDDQYSYLQQREFSLHNHLHSDPWNPFTVYVFTSDRKIKKIVFNNEVPPSLTVPLDVWEVPFHKERTRGYSNVSICFVSADKVVVSNGAGSLHILATGDRHQSDLWKEIHFESVPDNTRLTDARCPTSDQLHCLLCHVDTKQTYLTHLLFIQDEGEIWKVERSAIMFGKGCMDTAALYCDCQKAYVIGQVELKTQEYMDDETRNSLDTREVSFEWQQSYEEMKVWLDALEGSSPLVNVSSKKLEVKTADGILLLKGVFYRPVEDGLTIWQVKQRENQWKLEIILSKKDEGAMWPKIFESCDFRGKEIFDPEITAIAHSKLAHLTSEREDVGGATVLNSGQLEECDITESESRLLVSYDLSTSLIAPTSKVILGHGQWLMSSPREVDLPPQFCLRSDVDGIVWKADETPPKHVATLCAFGYVQASKTTRLFSFFPSDASYSGLVDADGRVFIYRGGERPTSRAIWGSQHIVSIGKLKILGVYATKSIVFILSEYDLHAIQLNPPSC